MGLQVAGCCGSSDELEQRRMSLLPRLMDVNPSSSSSRDKDKAIESPTAAVMAEAHVTCFSNAGLKDQKGQEESISPILSLVADYFNTSSTTPFFLSASSSNYPKSHHLSPSSLFVSKMNISAFLGNSQQQHCINPNNVSLMQLLQSNVYENGNGIVKEQRSYKADKEMLSNISQETGITTDMNPEISSVNNNNTIANNEVAGHSFDAQEVPSTSAATLHLEDCLWSY